MDAKVTVERGNPIVPPAPTHRIMPLPKQQPHEVKMVDGKEVVVSELSNSTPIGELESGGVDEGLQDKLEEEVDANPKGTIFIKLFENSPYEIDFSGVITGSEIDLAWRAMMKEYRVWKHTMFTKLEQAKIDGGG